MARELDFRDVLLHFDEESSPNEYDRFSEEQFVNFCIRNEITDEKTLEEFIESNDAQLCTGCNAEILFCEDPYVIFTGETGMLCDECAMKWLIKERGVDPAKLDWENYERWF